MSNIIEIKDFTAPELDVYARLSEGQLLNRHEPEKGMFIAESPKVIERALDAGCIGLRKSENTNSPLVNCRKAVFSIKIILKYIQQNLFRNHEILLSAIQFRRFV